MQQKHVYDQKLGTTVFRFYSKISNMGFCLQLKILIWKNITLKKRQPLILLMEILIPLIIFIIMVAIRWRQPPQPIPPTISQPFPLPSAGLMTTLLGFCNTGDGQTTDEYGFQNSGAQRIYEQLMKLNNMGEKYDFTSMGQSLDALAKFPKNSHQLLEDLKSTYRTLKTLYNLPLHEFFTNRKIVTDILANKLSIAPEMAKQIMDSTLDSLNVAESLSQVIHRTLKGALFSFMQNEKSEFAQPSDDLIKAVHNLTDVLHNGNSTILYVVEFLQRHICEDETLHKHSTTTPLGSILSSFCHMNADESQNLLTILLGNLHYIKLLAYLKPKNFNIFSTLDHIGGFAENVHHALDILKLVNVVTSFSKRLSLGTCNSMPGFGDHLSENTASNSTGSVSYDLLKSWMTMQKLLCGKNMSDYNFETGQRNGSHDATTSVLTLFSRKTEKLKMLFHSININTRILYAPNNTDADQIIVKANATFKMIGDISELAKKFIATSQTIRKYVLEKMSQRHIDSFLSTFRKIFNSLQFYINFEEDNFLDKFHVEKSSLMVKLEEAEKMACHFRSLTSKLPLNIFMGFRDEADAIRYFKEKAYADNKTVLASITFQMNKDGSMPKHLRYSIRQNATLTPKTNRVRPRFWAAGPNYDGELYYRAGFVWIQDLIDRAVISIHSGRDVIEPGSYAQEFPQPCYKSDKFIRIVQFVLPLCLTTAWVYTVSILVQHMVSEKEKRLKEVMKSMGMTELLHWLSWVFTSVVQLTISVFSLAVLLKLGNVLQYSNWFMIFLIFESYAISSVAFSFLLSSLFSKAKLAAACTGIIYFMAYIPFAYVSINEDINYVASPAWLKYLTCLFSTSAFGLATKEVAFFEQSGEGVHWNNWAGSRIELDAFGLRKITSILLLDTVIYFVLAWYIQNVHPGTYGLPRPWYFPFTKSYWFGQSKRDYTILLDETNGTDSTDDLSNNEFQPSKNPSHYFEAEPKHLRLGISITNLVKIYSGNKVAINGLSLNFYEGQITSFLGHNGAGKTTTMSILTGLIPATSGTAQIYDMDIRTDMENIRKHLGMCPQHNVLFDELTVEEHLWFYCRLKGMSSSDIILETERVIGDIGLLSKRNQRVEYLAGGMKRKLSVAIAFVAGSRTIILDEPTAGVDPFSRRAIWKLILKYKKERTILLSTHHMDEAEILGDRIAIIANGQLQCCGSALFLKSHLGTGYHLHLVKEQSSKCDDNDSADSGMDVESAQTVTVTKSSHYSNCSQKLITAFIRLRVPSAVIVSETPYELHYILPTAELREGNFEKLFLALDENLPHLQIQSYGVKSTTLEEVFLKVTSNHNLQMSNEIHQETHDSSQDATLIDVEDGGNDKDVELTELHSAANVDRLGNGASVKHFKKKVYQKLPLDDSLDIDIAPLYKHENAALCHGHVHGYRLWKMQLWAILHKRFLCTKRNVKGIISQILLPAFFVAVAMSVAITTPSAEDPSPLELSPIQFYNVSLPGGQFVPFANHYEDEIESANRWTKDASSRQLEATFKLDSGLGGSFTVQSNGKDITANGDEGKPLLQLLKNYYVPFDKPRLWDGKTTDNLVPASYDLNETRLGVTGSASGSTPYSLSGAAGEEIHSNTHRYHPICYCASDSTGFICSKDYENPPTFRATGGEIVLNISGDNEMDYLLYTDALFSRHRFGALSLGVSREVVPANFGKGLPTVLNKIAIRNAAKVWYNGKGYHALPVFLNVLNNAILRANVPESKGDPATFGITVINHPLPDTNALFEQEKISQGTDLIIAIFIITAMSFVPASFVLFLVTERYTKSKHLQILSGAKPFIYWIGNYFWDLCNSVVPSMVCIVILLIFDVPAYTSKMNLPAVILLFLFYGWSIAPVMYPVSFLFQEPSTAYVFLVITNLFIGITTLFTDSLLKTASSSDVLIKEIYQVVGKLFLIFPNFCLGKSLMDLSANNFNNELLSKTGRSEEMRTPWVWDLIPIKLVAMTFSGFVFFLITLLCEWHFSHKARSDNILDDEQCSPENEDDDVASERKRVLAGGATGDILRLRNLTKIYSTKKLGDCLAVDRLSVGIRAGECFGLLGVNGAGKTTTFRMLTGDTFSTAGDAFVNGLSINNELHSVQRLIGYCPQFDALHDDLTARESLTIYSCFRGIPSHEQEKVVNWAIKKLDLIPYADRLAGTFSGGNRRKLATALALIGNPAIIYLDEPSSGMDPQSKRFLWDTILDLARNGQSIVLSSHSMEECEALCSRLVIMVGGRFRCLGSVQHLKNKFGGGYFIVVRVKDKKFTPVVQFFKTTFPDSVIKEKHHNMLHYELKANNASLAYIFSCMEQALQQHPIEDYSVCQNTLDNVFVNFAKSTAESSAHLSNISIPVSEEDESENLNISIKKIS